MNPPHEPNFFEKKRLLNFKIKGLVPLSLEFQQDEPFLRRTQLQTIDNLIAERIQIQNTFFST
jgi:hypothetical protein